jgi:hypothetical protein
LGAVNTGLELLMLDMGVPHEQHVVVEVDIGPGQCERLALAHAGADVA